MLYILSLSAGPTVGFCTAVTYFFSLFCWPMLPVCLLECKKTWFVKTHSTALISILTMSLSSNSRTTSTVSQAPLCIDWNLPPMLDDLPWNTYWSSAFASSKQFCLCYPFNLFIRGENGAGKYLCFETWVVYFFWTLSVSIVQWQEPRTGAQEAWI